jgi:tetratricopeptide (TPR) repeat protein
MERKLKTILLILFAAAYSGLTQIEIKAQNKNGDQYGNYDDAINFMREEFPSRHNVLGWPELRSDWFIRINANEMYIFYEISGFQIWNEYLILTIREARNVQKPEGKGMFYQLGSVRYLNINLNDSIELKTIKYEKKGSSNFIKYKNFEIDHRGEKDLDARYRKNKEFDQYMVQILFNHIMVLKKTVQSRGINSDSILVSIRKADDNQALFSPLSNENIKNVVQNAVEISEFKKVADDYNKLTEKPTITEEQRKYIVQANALSEEKNYQKALEYYNKATGINPVSYPQAYYNMALIASQMNDYMNAILNMKKYLMLLPNAEDARAAQDKIYEWEVKSDN